MRVRVGAQAVHLMDREAHAEVAGSDGGVHVRYRVDCLLKAISACHKCDLDSAQVRQEVLPRPRDDVDKQCPAPVAQQHVMSCHVIPVWRSCCLPPSAEHFKDTAVVAHPLLIVFLSGPPPPCDDAFPPCRAPALFACPLSLCANVNRWWPPAGA